MAEYIEREALLKSICNSCDGWCDNTECDCMNCKSDHRCDMVEEISDFPAADVAPVVHGRVVTVTDRWKMMYQKCSECGETLEWRAYPNYCPNCGARMDGE